MQNGSGRGCSNRAPRDFKGGISFHRLPLKHKPFLKEWLVPIKRANFPKLSQCTSVRSTLRRSVSKVAVTLKFEPLECSDVMLCAQVFNMAVIMADVQIVLMRRFLLLQSG